MESDAELKAAVEALAADPTQSGSIHARAMLAFVFGEAIEETLIDPYTIQGRYAQYQTGEPAVSPAETYQLMNYPNPFSELTVISATLPEPGEIRVYDLMGREIQRMSMPEGESKVKFNAHDLKPGIYLYSLLIRGKRLASRLMVRE